MTTRELTEDQQRIRGYLLSQGEKYSWFELLPRVLDTRVQLLQAIEGLTEEQARMRSSADDWTVLEALDHAVSVADSTLRNVERLALGEPDSPMYQEPGQPSTPRSLAELRQALLANTAALVALPARMPETPPLEPRATHFMFGDLHCKAWFIFYRVHEVDHVGQIRNIREALGV